MTALKVFICIALMFLFMAILMIATGHAQTNYNYIAPPNMAGHPQTATACYGPPTTAHGDRPVTDFVRQTLSEQERPLGDVAREYRAIPRAKATKIYEMQGAQ